MKYFKSIIVCCLVISSFAQNKSNDFGVLSANLGARGGLGVATLGISGGNYSLVTASEAAIFTSNFPIDVNFGLLKPISVGLNFTPTNYSVIGEGGVLTAKNNSLGLNINFYIVNTPRFNMQLALTPYTVLTNNIELNYHPYSFNAKIKGSGFMGRLLFNIFFSENIGMYFGLGYHRSSYQLKSFNMQIANDDLEFELNEIFKNDISLRVPSFGLSIGIATRFPVIKN